MSFKLGETRFGYKGETAREGPRGFAYTSGTIGENLQNLTDIGRNYGRKVEGISKFGSVVSFISACGLSVMTGLSAVGKFAGASNTEEIIGYGIGTLLAAVSTKAFSNEARKVEDSLELLEETRNQIEMELEGDLEIRVRTPTRVLPRDGAVITSNR